jgi:hypothetical protein
VLVLVLALELGPGQLLELAREQVEGQRLHHRSQQPQ